MQNLRISLAAAALAGAMLASSASAVVIPFEEDFDAGPANWADNGGATANWFASGGPDGGAFVSAGLNFQSFSAGTSVVALRAQDEFNSSNGAFEGDWVASGVREFSAFIRHDAPVALTPFVRFATAANFPGAVTVGLAPIAANTWTEVTISISPNNPLLILEGPTLTFDDVFANVGHVQLGAVAPDSLAGVDQIIQFDADKASIIPAPGAAAAIGLAGLAGLRRRRR